MNCHFSYRQGPQLKNTDIFGTEAQAADHQQRQLTGNGRRHLSKMTAFRRYTQSTSTTNLRFWRLAAKGRPLGGGFVHSGGTLQGIQTKRHFKEGFLFDSPLASG